MGSVEGGGGEVECDALNLHNPPPKFSLFGVRRASTREDLPVGSPQVRPKLVSGGGTEKCQPWFELPRK